MIIGIDGRAAKWYRGTGIGTYTYQLISNLNKVDSKNNYSIFLPEGSALNLGDNFSVESVKAMSNNNFWEEVQVPNIFNSDTTDLYHVPQNGVGLSSKINCPTVITLHDIIPLKMPETVSDRYLKIFNEKLPEIISNCSGIITVSEFSKKDISKEFGFPESKILVTHLAAEEIYKPLNKRNCKRILESEYGIKDKFILYVGGFSPRKNIIGLIESFSLLNNEIKNNLKLIITGKKGLSYDIYKKRAEDLKISDSVIFTDFIPLEKLPIFYNASQLLVYPSFYEGFGLPPLEAMACGTPVISSNITSLPEVCNNSALLVNPYDVIELSISIEKVINDNVLRENMINSGFITSSSFSWKKTALKTIHSYKKIIDTI